MQNRRFSRIKVSEKIIITCNNHTVEADLLDISLKGALVRIEKPVDCQRGNKWSLSLRLSGSDIIMQFIAEVMHVRGDLVGVKFVETDLDTMIHLRNLMEARTMDPDQVRNELNFLVKSDR
ncbi:MAG TPA: PilZ domain-containing protein [Geobacteraceae bacterium]|jgi:c-di-GMP-binding flagellar brake protein YcgR|nr:PilZ domain-containing protein [Geobacteraceae bacterium]